MYIKELVAGKKYELHVEPAFYELFGENIKYIDEFDGYGIYTGVVDDFYGILLYFQLDDGTITAVYEYEIIREVVECQK